MTQEVEKLAIIPRTRVGYKMIDSQRRIGYNRSHISNKPLWNSGFF